MFMYETENQYGHGGTRKMYVGAKLDAKLTLMEIVEKIYFKHLLFKPSSHF